MASVDNVKIVQLEWKYSPADYLEEPLPISHNGVEFEISEGVISVNLEPGKLDANPNIPVEMTKKIENRLRSVQITTHSTFNLTGPTRVDIREDGGRNHYVELEFAVKLSVTVGDIVVEDRDGNVVIDSQKERRVKQEELTTALDKYGSRDDTLRQLLSSYEGALNDSSNELVHLYEMLDMLKARFGAEKEVRSQLDITSAEWEAIGKLANDPAISQGRHRGGKVDSLRDATESELLDARNSARRIIETYLEYLERVS